MSLQFNETCLRRNFTNEWIEFRKDITGAKKSIEKIWNEKYKVETIYFGDIIATKDWKNFTILNFLKKIHVFLESCCQKKSYKKKK